MGSADEGVSNVQEDLERHQHQPSPGLSVRRDLQLRQRLHLRHALRNRMRRPAALVPLDQCGRSARRSHFQVISIPKKCMKTCRVGRFFGFIWGLRM